MGGAVVALKVTRSTTFKDPFSATTFFSCNSDSSSKSLGNGKDLVH